LLSNILIKENFQIILIYILLVAGGIWNYLGFFKELMPILSGPFLISIAIYSIYKSYNRLNLKSFIYLLCLFIVTFSIEYYGVKTGLIFGQYQYEPTLIPQLNGVPIAIGFAWILMVVTSNSIVNTIFPSSNTLLKALFIALFMVIFDMIMEPAATNLLYWTWQNGIIPIQNFIAWFVIAFLISFISLKFSFLPKEKNLALVHLYFAQIVYFALSLLN
jgi:putative membrane protein